MSKRDAIFISYRRSDALGTTTAIRKTLLEHFGEDAVFRDLENINPGAEFPQALRGELARAAVVLAVIGKGWLVAANEWGQRRIDFEDDWVGIELSTALREPEVTVIPVLVDGASLPPAQALPPALRPLANRNAVVLRHEAWDDSFARLRQAVADVLKPIEVAMPPVGSETLTPMLLRQWIAEAAESIDNIGAQVLLSTVDGLSRMVATLPLRQLVREDAATLELLAKRLFRRPVVRVAAYLGELFPHVFTFTTADGKWLGYAIHEERRSYERDLGACVLILPGPAVEGSLTQVAGVAIVADVNIDYYGAASNEPPGPFESAGKPVVSIGTEFAG